MDSYKLPWLLIWSSAFVLFGALAVVEAETFPLTLTGAIAYDLEPVPDIDGFGWAFSTGTINPTEGQINHNSCAIAAYLGTAGISVFDGIRGSFTVDRSGPYKLHISGFIDGEIREGSSASITGVSKSGGRLLIEGGLTTVEDSRIVLHETDFSDLAIITEMAWAAWIVFLDRIDGTGVSAKLLSAIKDALTPRRLWNGEAFDLYSYDSLQAGIEYNWSFFVASAVAAGAFGRVRGVALYEANVYGLSVDLTYDEEIPQINGAREGGYLSLNGYDWDDSDGDGVMEAGEKICLKVQLGSTGNIHDVDAVLRTRDSKVSITDSTVYYQPFSADEVQSSVGCFDMDLNFELGEGLTRTSHFTLHLTYEENGLKYYQDISFDKVFSWQGAHVWFEISGYTINDFLSICHRNNEDSTFQSSEKIHIRPLLCNKGTANASRIDVSLLYDGEVLDIAQNDYRRYPDMAPGACGYPVNNGYFWIESLDWGYSGKVSLDVQVICPERSTPQVIKNAIQLHVQSVSVLSVYPRSQPPLRGTRPTFTTDIMRVRNAGSGIMTVSDVQTSHDDTVVPEADQSFTLGPGMERNVSIIIDTRNIPNVTTISREVQVISDGRIADMTPPSDRMIITLDFVGGGIEIFRVPGVTQGRQPDISGSWIVWWDSRNGNPDIYAYNISTGTEQQITTNPSRQTNARISGNLIAWNDNRNWDGTGDTSLDIYGYDLNTGQEFVISDDPADERLIGVDNGKVAFSKVYYVFTEQSGRRDVSNLWQYDHSTGTDSNVTEFTSNTSHNPMHTVEAGHADFGGGLLVWQESTMYWAAQYENWAITDNRVCTMRVGLTPDRVPSGPHYPKSADTDRFVWAKEDNNDDLQVWIWDNGSVDQVTNSETNHGEYVLAVGKDFVTYSKDSASSLFYWDLDDDREFLLTEQLSFSEDARMDANRVVWNSLVDSEWQIYFASLDGSFSDCCPQLTIDPGSLSPANGFSGPRQIAFDWAAVLNTAGYAFQIDTVDVAFNHLWCNDEVFEWPVTKTITSVDAIYWRVKALAPGVCGDGPWTSPLVYIFEFYQGDFNGDDEVDLDDFVLFVNAYGTSRASDKWDSMFDLNGDGEVGLGDFVIFVDNYGKGNSTAKSVPTVHSTASMMLAEDLEEPFTFTVHIQGISNPSSCGLILQYNRNQVTFEGLEGEGLHFEHEGQLIVAYRMQGREAKLKFRLRSEVRSSVNAIEVLEGVVINASEEILSVNVVTETLPAAYRLSQNYPNPFNPLTTITYDLPIAAEVRLTIYNVTGQQIATLVSKPQTAGHYQEAWNGAGFANGIYVYRLQAGQFEEARRMILLK